MTKAFTITLADTVAHNLYGAILASLSVTQLPQRVDLGVVFPPDFVASVAFFLPVASAGQTLVIEDQNGNSLTAVGPQSNISIGNGQINCISLQALQIKASNAAMTVNVTVFQV